MKRILVPKRIHILCTYFLNFVHWAAFEKFGNNADSSTLHFQFPTVCTVYSILCLKDKK